MKPISLLREFTCQWDHTVLPATRQRRPPRHNPSWRWYSIHLSVKDERLSWPENRSQIKVHTDERTQVCIWCFYSENQILGNILNYPRSFPCRLPAPSQILFYGISTCCLMWHVKFPWNLVEIYQSALRFVVNQNGVWHYREFSLTFYLVIRDVLLCCDGLLCLHVRDMFYVVIACSVYSPVHLIWWKISQTVIKQRPAMDVITSLEN